MIELTQKEIEAILNYLSQRPWIEVNALIAMISNKLSNTDDKKQNCSKKTNEPL